MKKPLAEYLRPSDIDDIVGQSHLTGENGVIYRAIKKSIIPNMIFYGPPGVGKTSVANVIAQKSGKSMHMLNATQSNTSEMKEVLGWSKSGAIYKKDIIYIDEIQSFNKKQQQVLLDHIEKGDITLIASTTENPYHYVYKALLSRCLVLEFNEININDIENNLKKIIERLNKEGYSIFYKEEAIKKISSYSDGDMRKGINLLELIIQLYYENEKLSIDDNLLENLNISKQMVYDLKGDSHYDALSAFQKSIRGSDVDAALHYLARIIKAGDLKSICRRLLVIASEDIGLAYPNAISIVKSCVDSAIQLGFPEAKIPLSQAVILLSMSPKSNSAVNAIASAEKDLEESFVSDVPLHLKDSHYDGAEKMNRGTDYKYPHDYENSYVYQEYLPKSLKGKIYYKPKENKFEKGLKDYIDKIKNI